MASGGNDPLDTDTIPNGSNASAPRDQLPPGTTQFNLNQFNFLTPTVRANVSAANMEVRGPLIVMQNPYAPRARHQRPQFDDQALWTLPEPVDVSPEFRESDLDREILDKFLSYVANYCDEDPHTWRRIARKLKLDAPSVARMEENYSDNIRELIYQLLLTWKRRHAVLRVRDLVKVLCESRLQKQALELKKYFSSIHG